MFRKTITVGGAVLLAAAVLVPASSAQAATVATTAVCKVPLGNVLNNEFNDLRHVRRAYNASSPPGATPGEGWSVYKSGQIRLNTTFLATPKGAGETHSGLIVVGDVLSSVTYVTTGQTSIDPDQTRVTRVGSGWSRFRWIDVSVLGGRSTLYAFRDDGKLMRWTKSGTGWAAAGSVGGLSTVRSMALIGRGAGYDTFLANTRAGALITVRIPTTSPLKPVATTIRASSWQGFENLLVASCGKSGSVVFGIDVQHTDLAGQMYAFGHANGTATVIKNLGSVGVGDDYKLPFRWTTPNEAFTGA
ncbi:hypothetical protein [Kribbella sp. NPDC055071]